MAPSPHAAIDSALRRRSRLSTAVASLHRSAAARPVVRAPYDGGRVEVDDALRALGGAARWRELRRLVSRAAMRAALEQGRVLQVAGVWQLPDRDRALTAAVQMRGARSHRSAAEFWGFALPPSDDRRHDVTVPWKARRADVPEDVRLWYRDLPDHERAVGVTSAVTTTVDCLRDLSLRDALSIGDSAPRSGLVDYEELTFAVRRLRGPGSRIARERLALLDARAANAFESSARALLVEAGLRGFRPQFTIRSRGRWIGCVDLADVELRIVVECEGFAYHGDRPAFTKDVVRFTSLVAAGWRPLRFTWEQVMFDPEWVIARVLETVELARSETRTTVQRASAARRRAA